MIHRGKGIENCYSMAESFFEILHVVCIIVQTLIFLHFFTIYFTQSFNVKKKNIYRRKNIHQVCYRYTLHLCQFSYFCNTQCGLYSVCNLFFQNIRFVLWQLQLRLIHSSKGIEKSYSKMKVVFRNLAKGVWKCAKTDFFFLNFILAGIHFNTQDVWKNRFSQLNCFSLDSTDQHCS